jgi:uncharacterized Rossmann fold enzyme
MTDAIAFVCVNVGQRYPMAYVEILRDMVLRNCSTLDRHVAWFCITDRPKELPQGVYPIAADPTLPGYWQKVRLFAPDMPWEIGQRVVYFDLDVAITGRIEDLVERKGIIQDWHWPMFNSSVMVWDHGEHREVWLDFGPWVMERPSRPEIARLLPAGQINGGDQEWITSVDETPTKSYSVFWEPFPDEWFCSYRSAQVWPPSGCKAVIFHGAPKPDEVTTGWVPNVWKIGGLTSLPVMKGANTTEDQRLANVEASCKRDLPWFTGFRDEGSSCVIVGGAPSMLEHLADIRFHGRHKKTRVITVNNAWRVLMERGVTPHAHVMLDARPENAEFIKGMPSSIRLLLASQCHPDVFDAAVANGNEIALWHCGYGDNDALWKVLEPYTDTHPIILVPGGGTVGLRAMWLATFSGFRTLRIYGMDSSYAEDGSHHAYAQALNDGEQVIEVVRGGRKYRCALWMTRQAAEFEQTWRDLRTWTDFEGKPAPVSIFVHGDGLIPDIAAELRRAERAAA